MWTCLLVMRHMVMKYTVIEMLAGPWTADHETLLAEPVAVGEVPDY